MKKTFLLTLCLSCLLPLTLFAQQQNDSVPQIENTGLTDKDIQELTQPIATPLQDDLKSATLTPRNNDLPVHPALEPKRLPMHDMKFELFPKGSQLPQWTTGYMDGFNAVERHLYYGYIAHAGMGVHQQLGRHWTVNGGVGLNKLSVYGKTADFSGSVTWQANRYFSTTMFGQYSTSFASPTQFIPSSFQWGGYITLQTDTDLPFGIDAGARTGYDPLSGHWVTPIIQPFVKLGDAKLGIDVGPIIQEALRNAAGMGHHDGPSPMPRPAKNLPTVAPRR